MTPDIRRLSFVTLCAAPLVAAALAASRALRVEGVHQAIGVVFFLVIAGAVWQFARLALRSRSDMARRLAVAGALLVVPFALVGLLWVGLATPWEATPLENRMRYAVLLAMSVAVTTGLLVLDDALRTAGERLWSLVGSVAAGLAGAAYVVWLSFQLGLWVLTVRDGRAPQELASLNQAFDVLLFAACALTYGATAGFTASLGRVGWMGRGVAAGSTGVNVVALAFLVARGLSFPNPAAINTPWYLTPGFVAGIPAIPWIVPALLGAILLRRAGDVAS